MRTVYQPLTRYTAIANGSSFAAFLCHPTLLICSPGSSTGRDDRVGSRDLPTKLLLDGQGGEKRRPGDGVVQEGPKWAKIPSQLQASLTIADTISSVASAQLDWRSLLQGGGNAPISKPCRRHSSPPRTAGTAGKSESEGFQEV